MPNTPNLDLEEPAHGSASWDTPLNSNFSKIDAGVVVNAPVADQTITGVHSLTMSDPASRLWGKGFLEAGPPFSSLSSYLQNLAGGDNTQFQFSNYSLAPNASTFLGGAQFLTDANGGLNGGGIFSIIGSVLGADTAANAALEAGFFEADINLNGFNASNPVATIMGVQGNANVNGNGSIANVVSVAGGGNFIQNTPTVAVNTAYYAFVNNTKGTINSLFYGEDQGSASNAYGIYLTGSTHNNLGGGQTKVGGLHITLSGVSIRANNAAAIAAGLVAGDLYRTGGDPDILCIVH